MIEGAAWIMPDDLDTDMIYPANFMNTADREEMGRHCMAGMDPEFPQKIRKGDIMVGGKNFGCGSSREHAPISILAAGIDCVIARSFARIFYRNAINIGLPILENPEVVDDCRPGDILTVDFASGLIENKTLGKTYHAEPFPPFIQKIIACHGLIEYLDTAAGGQNL